jgi:hypothetical protein
MKIIFLGDIVVDRKVTIDNTLSKLLHQADYVIGNLEGVIVYKTERIKSFKTYGSIIHNDYDSIMDLIDQVGITHVNLYNNHMIDYGEKLFKRTIDILKNAGIKVLFPKNTLQIGATSIKLNNSGLAENFGMNSISKNFGNNINDLIFEKELLNDFSESIIYTHFGIEAVNGLSDYEIKWFDLISRCSPKLIIRHHPHCVQTPFILNGVPCFPSIGDFAFNFHKKSVSYGQIVLFNNVNSNLEYYLVKCKDYHIDLKSNNLIIKADDYPVRLTEEEMVMLRKRFEREYRENRLLSLKKAFKYLVGKEKTVHVIPMSSTHFIQPFVIGEIF